MSPRRSLSRGERLASAAPMFDRIRMAALRCVALLLALGLNAACGSKTTTNSPDEEPQHGCTNIGCSDGLSITLEPNANWPHGRYEFELTINAQPSKCTGTLPLRACSSGPALTCVGAAVRIGESGCALPPSAHGFSELWLDGAPAQISITIRHDERELLQNTLKPTYRRSQPNGPGCPPTCNSAHETLRVF